MRYHVAVGTHQKTGTVWMNDTFRDLAEALNRPYRNISRLGADQVNEYVRKQRPARKGHSILFDNHSAFPDEITPDRFRGLHLIRDPRDMIISAIRYHETTEAKWANTPNRKYGGKSLRDALGELERFEDKLLFEIEHVAADNILPMARFDGRGVFATVRYEDLVVDTTLELSSGILGHLGFDEYESILGLIAFWRNSLFGLKRTHRSGHIRDGSAKQHETAYSERAMTAFNNRFGQEIERLGYDLPPSASTVPEAISAYAIPAPVERARKEFARQGDGGMGAAARIAIELQPKNPLGHTQLARILLGERRLEGARQAAETAVAQGPKLAAAHFVLGDIAEEQEDRSTADRAMANGVALNPRSIAHIIRLTDSRVARGQNREADRLLSWALRKSPNNKTLLERQARLHESPESNT